MLVELIRGAREDVSEDYAVRIFRCSDIGEPVLTLREIPNYDYAAWGGTRPRGGLIVDPPFLPEGSWDASDVAALIWPEVVEPIMGGHWSYSKAGKRYVPFTADDLVFIKEALEYDEENAL